MQALNKFFQMISIINDSQPIDGNNNICSYKKSSCCVLSLPHRCLYTIILSRAQMVGTPLYGQLYLPVCLSSPILLYLSDILVLPCQEAARVFDYDTFWAHPSTSSNSLAQGYGRERLVATTFIT